MINQRGCVDKRHHLTTRTWQSQAAAVVGRKLLLVLYTRELSMRHPAHSTGPSLPTTPSIPTPTTHCTHTPPSLNSQ